MWMSHHGHCSLGKVPDDYSTIWISNSQVGWDRDRTGGGDEEQVVVEGERGRERGDEGEKQEEDKERGVGRGKEKEKNSSWAKCEKRVGKQACPSSSLRSLHRMLGSLGFIPNPFFSWRWDRQWGTRISLEWARMEADNPVKGHQSSPRAFHGVQQQQWDLKAVDRPGI